MKKNELTYGQLDELGRGKFQYLRFSYEGVLSGSNDKKVWKKVDVPKKNEGESTMRFSTHQIFDIKGVLVL